MKLFRLSLLAIIFPFVLQAQSIQLPTQFIGRWKADCDRAGYIDVARDGSVTIEVNSNQIYVDATAIIDKADPTKIIIFLKEPADLGAGGMRLNWDKFSKTKPIAEIQALPTQKKRSSCFGMVSIIQKQKSTSGWTKRIGLTSKVIMKRCISV
jgi:hypothetical protein